MRPTDCQNQCWFFLLILLLPIHGFTQRTISLKTSFQRQQKGRSFVISNKNNNNIININNNNVETTVGTTTSTLSESTIVVTTTPTKLTIRLEQHKPLGCTVEESLADPLKVFITKILPGSFADQAGLQIGDVIDGVSGFFGSVTATIGLEQVYVHPPISSASEPRKCDSHVLHCSMSTHLFLHRHTYLYIQTYID